VAVAEQAAAAHLAERDEVATENERLRATIDAVKALLA
jgi:hypothetical protein